MWFVPLFISGSVQSYELPIGDTVVKNKPSRKELMQSDNLFLFREFLKFYDTHNLDAILCEEDFNQPGERMLNS